MREFYIAIEAQIANHEVSGGVATYLAALIKALGELEGPEQYAIVCASEDPKWLEPYLGPNQRIVPGPRRPARELIKHVFGKRWTKVWDLGYSNFSKVYRSINLQKALEGLGSDMHGFYEGLPASLVHVFYQTFIKTDLPVIFNPHDLQHEHFPEFFDPEILARRRYVYKSACLTAAAVVAGSQYTKDDVINKYNILPEKMWVIPLGPANASWSVFSMEGCRDVLRKHHINYPFMFYPAVTWEHKNHLRLLEAIANLRRQGKAINLVCSGALIEPGNSKIRRYIQKNDLGDAVKFLGFLPSEEVNAIYKTCRFVITSSLFEEDCRLMVEGWLAGKSIAASAVCSLTEQAGGAALLFDPYSISEIEGAILKLWNDEALRHDLEQKGTERLKNYSWERTAKAYRALYRLIGGRPLSDEDQSVLGWDWIADIRKGVSFHRK